MSNAEIENLKRQARESLISQGFTGAQADKIVELLCEGYSFDEKMSVAYCAAVYSCDGDLWIMGLDGSIAHNPSCLVINV